MLVCKDKKYLQCAETESLKTNIDRVKMHQDFVMQGWSIMQG